MLHCLAGLWGCQHPKRSTLYSYFTTHFCIHYLISLSLQTRTSGLEGGAQGHRDNDQQRWDENLSFLSLSPRFLPLGLQPLDRQDFAACVPESPGKKVTRHRHWDRPLPPPPLQIRAPWPSEGLGHVCSGRQSAEPEEHRRAQMGQVLCAPKFSEISTVESDSQTQPDPCHSRDTELHSDFARRVLCKLAWNHLQT